MKIALITGNFFPEKTGIGVTATDCARFLSDLGHEVTVFTSMPYYPEWRIHKEYRNRGWVSEQLGKVRVNRCWLYVPGKTSTVKRLLHEASIAVGTFVRALFCRCDLILGITPPLTLCFASAVLSVIKRKKFWCYVKDVQPDAAIELGMLRNPVLVKLSRWMEMFIYRRSEKVLVLGPGMRRNLEKKGVSAERLAVIPDSIEVEELSVVQSGNHTESFFSSDQVLRNKFLVLYSGNLGVKHNPLIIAETARLLRSNDDIRLVVVGEGAMKSGLEEKISEYGLRNLKLLPLCERKELGWMLHSADVLLLSQCATVVDIVVPSKLLAYLCSGRPVIASVNSESEAGRLLSVADAGVVVAPENPQLICDAVLKLKGNNEWARNIGENGLKLVRNEFEHSIVKDKYYRPLFQRSGD